MSARYRAGRLYAIDPGTAKAGMAVFDNGVLRTALTLWRPRPKDFHAIADREGLWVREKMHKYPTARAMHKDLDEIEALCKALRVRWSEAFRPQRWKGSIPKRIHHERLRALLLPSEVRVWDAAGEDGRDAAGVGLFAMGRCGRGGMPGDYSPDGLLDQEPAEPPNILDGLW